jgi:type II secretory ATPase GspE/PulE/Tfp pilus assembly ATPase PilB-like protein
MPNLDPQEPLQKPFQEPFQEIYFSPQNNTQAANLRLNIDQMLSLVDSILPFEACLFYQVIPLSIEAGHLNLGMVDPADTTALDYVRRQVSYIKYSVVSWPIDSDWHRQMLSQYLSYASKAKPRKSPLATGHTPAWPTPALNTPENDQLTFVVDSPTEITDTPPISPSASLASSPLAGDHPDAPPPLSASPSPLQIELDAPVSAASTPSDLTALPPKMLMQTLLKQVLSEGIGRLYFERQAHSGKVLCSQDGVLQSVVDDLSLDLFQSVINELKRLTHLPLLPVTTTRQAEIERLYHQDRVLLRLRIIAGTHGEEATLQVLRGAALKFHQQQQIEQLGRDALGIAQTLQQRIHAIRDRSRQSLVSDSPPTATLLAVSNMLKAIETQINQLLQAHEHTDRS